MYNPTLEKPETEEKPKVKPQKLWTAKLSWVPIKDEIGNEIEVPTLGSWTLNELEGIQELVKQTKGNDAAIAYEGVAFFFEMRGADLSEIVGDVKNIPLSLIKEMWAFFQNENESLSKGGDDEEPTGKRSRGKKST